MSRSLISCNQVLYAITVPPNSYAFQAEKLQFVSVVYFETTNGLVFDFNLYLTNFVNLSMANFFFYTNYS